LFHFVDAIDIPRIGTIEKKDVPDILPKETRETKLSFGYVNR